MARKPEARFPITAQNKTERAFKQVKSDLLGLERVAFNTKAAFGGIAGAAAFGTLGSQVFDVSRRFETLNASLITVTGSAELADLAFSRIRVFASQTPFSISEVTQAFIKLKAMGLDPSERALRSYGNTAGAMGKSLEQMIEAVADAATKEFERLKEFGIVTRQHGDKVAFTFKGMKTVVGNNVKEIQEYLLSLGEIQFAGGMARQAATIDGAVSNLGDSWDNLMDSFGKTANIKEVSSLIGGLTSRLNAASAFLDRSGAPRALALRLERSVLEAEERTAPKYATGYEPDSALQRRARLKEINAEFEVLKKKRAEQKKAQAEQAKIDAATAELAAKALRDESEKKANTAWMKKAQDDLNESLKKSNKLFMDGERLRSSLLTPTEKYNEAIKKSIDLLAEGVISEETYERSLLSAKDALDDQADAQIAAIAANQAFRDSIVAIVDPLDDYRKDMLDLNVALEMYPELSDKIVVAMEKLEDGLGDGAKDIDSAWKDLGGTFSSAFEDAIVGGGKLSDVLKGLEQDIMRIVTRRMVTEPLANSISGFAESMFSGSGSGSGGFADFFGGLFGGARALGGPVAAGVPYLVGERGPELFVPQSSGNIKPNNQLGGGAVTIINKITVQAPQGRLAPESLSQLQSKVGAATQRALRRNG